jgi:hypothetical protein
MLINQKEMTASEVVLCCALSFKAWLVIVIMLYIRAFVLLIDVSSLGTPQQPAECPLRRCWSSVALSLMKWSSVKLQ